VAERERALPAPKKREIWASMEGRKESIGDFFDSTIRMKGAIHGKK